MSKLSLLSNSPNEFSGLSGMSSASQARAAYVMLSYNGNNGVYHYMNYDSEFMRMGPNNNSYYGHSAPGPQDRDDTHANTSMMTGGNASGSQSTNSSSSSYYPNGLYHGEYGMYLMSGASSRGNDSSNFNGRWGTTSFSYPAQAAASFCNADQTDRTRALQLDQGYLTYRFIDRPWSYGMWNTYLKSGASTKNLNSSFPSGTNIGNMYGSASYNNVRKELVVMAYNGNTTGRFDICIWKNVDLDANDDVSTLSNTPTLTFNVTTPSWQTTNNESRYNISVVLVDDGSIFYSVFYPSNGFYLYKITRAALDASVSVASISSQGVTTSYGIEQGIPYGQRAMQTRNGRMVMTYCPYYYYAQGIRSWTIDKRNSTYVQSISDSSSGTTYQPMKYRDDSFIYYYSGNYYAGNYSGGYMYAPVCPDKRSSTASPIINTSFQFYLPYAPGPNTTNYPGMGHVWDYDLGTTLPHTVTPL